MNAATRPFDATSASARNPWARAVAAVARREREVRDVLWLLLTLAWVISPHVADLPGWASASVFVLLAWRAWLTWAGHRLPHRLIPVALTCVAGIAVWLEYRTIFGKDAGVTFVVLLLGLKLLEMRARRDIFVVVFLSLFVMLTSLFESQSIAMAASLVVGLWMLVTALVSVQFVAHEPAWRTKAGIAARLVAYAVPLMAVLFVFFPRIEGPLWGMPSDAYAAKTGLSDTMTPGSFGPLSQSREMAFRVRFAGAPAAPADRYWRGPVLGAYDGRTWRALPPRRRGAGAIVVDRSSAVDYVTTLEPSNRPWLFALELTAEPPTGTALAPRVRADLQVVGESLVLDRAAYVARAYTRYRVGADETRAHLQDWVELPPGFDPRTHAYAVRLLAEEERDHGTPATADDEARRAERLVRRVLTMIRTDGFAYTLDPPELGRDAVDEFLFDSRRGFCEHYAGAFVFLMRALDLPARVVTGYQGGEINPVDGYLEVRQRDAHAWAEVWMPGEGWRRVDPTAAVAPDRIEVGAEALDTARGFAGFGPRGTWVSRLLAQARFNLDAIGNHWNQWVLAYNADRQSGLFSGFGIERIDWQVLTVFLIVAFAVILSGIGALTLYRRVRTDPVVLLYARACERVARTARRQAGSRGTDVGVGFDRRPAEGARDYLARMRDRLPGRMRERAELAFALYEQLRYARHHGDAALRARFARAVDALRR